MIGTSSSSSTEAWLVHPEPDTWLALSASTTTTLGLDGASSAGPGEEGAAGTDEEEEGDEAASGADKEPEGAVSSVPAASLNSLYEKGCAVSKFVTRITQQTVQRVEMHFCTQVQRSKF